MMPDTGAETPRISITVSSALPPVASVAARASCVDDPGLHQGADHDEQPGEEQQRLPLDAGQVVGSLQPRDQDQDAGAEQRHHRGLDVQHRVGDERGEHRDRARRRT